MLFFWMFLIPWGYLRWWAKLVHAKEPEKVKLVLKIALLVLCKSWERERERERESIYKQEDTANIFGVKTRGRRVDRTERKLATVDRLTVNVKTSQSLFTDSTNGSIEYCNARTSWTHVDVISCGVVLLLSPFYGSATFAISPLEGSATFAIAR